MNVEKSCILRGAGVIGTLAGEYGATHADLSRSAEPSHIFNQYHLNLAVGLAFCAFLEVACVG